MSGTSGLFENEPYPGDAVEAASLCFERGPKGLRMFLGQERCFLFVRVRLADPLRQPGRYYSIIDSRDREICLLDSLDGLDQESRRIVNDELSYYYSVPIIAKVDELSIKQGPLYWQVDTNWGPREFVVNWNSDNVMKLPDGRLRLTDVDGNRFDMPEPERLDADSRKRIEILR